MTRRSMASTCSALTSKLPAADAAATADDGVSCSFFDTCWDKRETSSERPHCEGVCA